MREMPKKLMTEELGAVDTGPERKWQHIGKAGDLGPVPAIVEAECGEKFMARGYGTLRSILAKTNVCPDCKRIALARYGGGPA